MGWDGAVGFVTEPLARLAWIRAHHGVPVRPGADDAVRARVLLRKGMRPRTSGCRWSGTCSAGSACAGTASSARSWSAATARSSARAGRTAAVGPGAVMSKPTLAVWKFASCDGCQLTLLDCEDELLALAAEVTIAHFLEASAPPSPGPYDVSLVEGSVTTTAGRGADPGDPRAVTDAGDDRRVRDRRRHPGAAQLRRRGRVRLGGLRQPGVHRHAGHLDADLGARAGRLRAARLPHRPPPAAGGDRRLLVGRKPASPTPACAPSASAAA